MLSITGEEVGVEAGLLCDAHAHGTERVAEVRTCSQLQRDNRVLAYPRWLAQSSAKFWCNEVLNFRASLELLSA